MTKKQTIIFFYVAIAVLCAGIIWGFTYWGNLREERNRLEHEKRKGERVADIREQQRKQFKNFGFKTSFKCVNQEGKEIDFKEAFIGKVVVMVQFYAACPKCDSINMKLLSEVHEKYASNKDLQIVAVNVNAETKGVEAMKNYWERKAGMSPQWWFVNGDVDAFNNWASENLAFAKFQRNSGPEAELEPVNHDMGIVVVKRDGVMFAKEDYYSAILERKGISEEERVKFAEEIRGQLFQAVKTALEN